LQKAVFRLVEHEEHLVELLQVVGGRLESNNKSEDTGLKGVGLKEILDVLTDFELLRLGDLVFVGESLEPSVVEKLECRRPLLGVGGERRANKVFCIIRYNFPVGVLKIQVVKLNQLENLFFALGHEWRSARQQNVGDDPNAPDIDLGVVLLPVNDLRCHVERRAQHLVQTLLGVVEGGEPEIRHFELQRLCIGCLHKNILWFDVAVGNVPLVHIVDCQQDLF